MSIVTSLLAKAMGQTDRPEKERAPLNLDALPESLKGLAETILKASDNRRAEERDAGNAAERRQAQANSLQKAFIDTLQELADINAAMNNTQQDALKQAQNRAKRDDIARKRDEAVRKRASDISALENKQKAARAGLGVDLLGALFGRGAGDIARNIVAAEKETDSDVGRLSEARYADAMATAEEKRDTVSDLADAAAEKAASEASGTGREAIATMKTALEGQSEMLAHAIEDMKEASARLGEVDAAEANLAAVKASRDKIEAAGAAEMEAASASVSPAGIVMPGVAAPVTGAPLIVAPDGSDAIAAARSGALAGKVAARNNDANVAVSEASDALMKAREAAAGDAQKGIRPAEVQLASSGLMAQMATDAIASIRKTTEETLKDAIIGSGSAASGAVAAKAVAENVATEERKAATEKMMAGGFVTADERKSIEMGNVLTDAIAPPAVTLLAKVMDEFRSLFPVIEQGGNALVELGTVLPATLFTVGGQMVAGFQYALSEVRDALPFGKSGARSRYNDENENGARVTAYAQKQENALKAYKDMQDRGFRGNSGAIMVGATGGRVVANSPREYTYTDTTGTASGVVHAAREVAETRTRPVTPVPQVRNERALGVIPVGPSNGSVDNWRN